MWCVTVEYNRGVIIVAYNPGMLTDVCNMCWVSVFFILFDVVRVLYSLVVEIIVFICVNFVALLTLSNWFSGLCVLNRFVFS